jgi:hypothetical protein
VTIECTALRPKRNRSSEYSGWHSEWFYLKNDIESPLPVYTGGYYDMTQTPGRTGP